MDRRTRIELSDLAARIMAESGVSWQEARTKAARRLSVSPGAASQVDEAEVLAALRSHQSLFLPDQGEYLRHLREAALQAMRLLGDFHPILVGAVAEGTVTAHSPIELEVSADSEKDVEHLLLNAGVGYEVVSPHCARAIQYRCAESEPVVLITANIRSDRGAVRKRKEMADRLNIDELERLLADPAA
jgi:hypothetical protein